jgi:hypothetical protein
MNVLRERETNNGKIPEKICGPSCKGQTEELMHTDFYFYAFFLVFKLIE